MIEVICHPKVVSQYKIPEYYDDDIDDLLDYGQYGNCVYKNNLAWSDNSSRNDTISYNKAKHWDGLKKTYDLMSLLMTIPIQQLSMLFKNNGIALLR